MYISYSAISTLGVCGAKIKFKNAGFKGPMGAALVYGSLFHHGVAAAYGFGKNGTDYKKAISEGLDAVLRGQWIPGEREQKNWDGTLKVNAKDMSPEQAREWLGYAVDEYLKVFPNPPIQMEFHLTKPYEGFTLEGYVDAFYAGYIADFKLIGDRLPDMLQGVIYAILMGGPTRMEFHVIKKKSFPEVSAIPCQEALNPDYIKFVETNIIPQAARLLINGDLPANPGQVLCDEKYCQYWQHCVGSIKKGLPLGAKA